MPKTSSGEQAIAGSDDVSIAFATSQEELFIRYKCGPSNNAIHLFIALNTHREIGAAVLPFLQHAEGSTVFLPFKADLLLSAEIRGGQIVSFIRRWERWRWSERERTDALEASELNGQFIFRIPRALFGDAASIDFVVYANDPDPNSANLSGDSMLTASRQSSISSRITSRAATLELHDGNGATIGVNDNWKDDQPAEIQATGIAPSDDRESAIVRVIPGGNYTAIVRGVGDNVGIAVVEAYNLP